MRVSEPGGHAGLAAETLLELGAAAEQRGEQLEGDDTVPLRVDRLVDVTHPAGADETLEAVPPELAAVHP